MSSYVDAAFTRKHLDQGGTVVNVLPAGQYQEKHLPGSINVPLEEPDFERRVQEAVPDKGTPVIVHCSSMECQASTKAARRLEALGYKDVHDFKAGLQGWEQAGLPFESGQPAPTAPATPTPASSSRPPRPGRDRSSRHEETRGREVPKL
jgi:rhodanese-related sulfurtransferase